METKPLAHDGSEYGPKYSSDGAKVLVKSSLRLLLPESCRKARLTTTSDRGNIKGHPAHKHRRFLSLARERALVTLVMPRPPFLQLLSC